MKRRLFLGGSAAALVGCRRRTPIATGRYFSVAELTEGYQDGHYTPESVLQHYRERISQIDRQGPALRAVVELGENVKLPGLGRGWLQGVPVLVKDNIETADGMETTAGSLALLGAPRPAQDATMVKNLRAAGAVVFGKTNLSEWANIRSPNSTSGWSARGGLTRNPHDLEYSASGSSTGSAVAVAAGLCAAAVGTETNGSIIAPASMCGIVGLKPTLGLISRAGIIPISRWQDTAGPMTRTVRDAALMLNAMAGRDARDPHFEEFKGEANYASLLADGALKGRRLGVLRNLGGMDRGVASLFEETLETLHHAGAVLVDELELPHRNEASSSAWMALLTELRQDLNRYLETRGAAVRSISDLRKYNEEYRDQEMRYFNQEFLVEADSRASEEHLKDAAGLRATARRLSGEEGLAALMDRHSLDALICPTNDPAGRVDLELGDARVRVSGGPCAIAGYPHLTVPMGLVEGLPVGLSLMGRPWSESLLFQLGHAYERIRPFEPRLLFT